MIPLEGHNFKEPSIKLFLQKIKAVELQYKFEEQLFNVNRPEQW